MYVDQVSPLLWDITLVGFQTTNICFDTVIKITFNFLLVVLAANYEWIVRLAFNSYGDNEKGRTGFSVNADKQLRTSLEHSGG